MLAVAGSYLCPPRSPAALQMLKPMLLAKLPWEAAGVMAAAHLPAGLCPWGGAGDRVGNQWGEKEERKLVLSRGKRSRDGEMRGAGCGEGSPGLGERTPRTRRKKGQGENQGAEIEMGKWIWWRGEDWGRERNLICYRNWEVQGELSIEVQEIKSLSQG